MFEMPGRGKKKSEIEDLQSVRVGKRGQTLPRDAGDSEETRVTTDMIKRIDTLESTVRSLVELLQSRPDEREKLTRTNDVASPSVVLSNSKEPKKKKARVVSKDPPTAE